MKHIKVLPLLLTMFLSACLKDGSPLTNRFFCFDTMVYMSLYDSTRNNIEDLDSLFRQYDKLCDNYEERDITNVYSLNKTNEEVTVSEELYELLSVSLNVKNEGATYFNPLCGSLAKKWKEAINNQQILDEITKNEEISKINNSELLLKENNVVQRIGDAEIDLGAIAKGYVLDKAFDYLKEKNITNFMVDAGSSSVLLGEKKTGNGYFTVGLKDIDSAYFKAKNCFISTSGLSEQGVTINGKRYSHIVNPITGSAESQYNTVIVISNKGYYGDAMSTSLMMNTINEIKQIEQEHNIQTLVIKDNKIVYCNEGIEVLYH